MLENLQIRNLAVIDHAEIPFRTGLNILSGETGAGKSIVIEAISLLLGSRASSSLIRAGCAEAIIEGVFDLERLPEIHDRLPALGFPQIEKHQLLIKRTVHRTGKHRITINGELATLGNLQTLCSGLVDLCSQHEHQSLLRPGTQIDLLDRSAGLLELRDRYQQHLLKLKALTQDLKKLKEQEATRLQRLDFLRFQVDELREADLQPNEEESLQHEKSLLQSAKFRIQTLSHLHGLLEDGEEGNALQWLQQAVHKTQTLAEIDPSMSRVLESLQRALVEIEDSSLALRRYENTIDHDPSRLDQILERLARIAELRRKYGEDSTQMLKTLERLDNELRDLDRHEERSAELETQIESESSIARAIADELSRERHKVAAKLSMQVTRELRELNMKDSSFEIEIQSLERTTEQLGTWGMDDVCFKVRTNQGEDAQPIGKIASGGELSRILLAIRRVISVRGGIGVYLFDEIDSGMGGQTAFQVGKKLKAVASDHQVICITHLPQVASFGDHHLVVQKSSNGRRTLTEVRELDKRSRKEELARMLGGEALTRKSLENAAELLEMATG